MGSKLDETETRKLIVEEVKSWLGTPWHHEARIKGQGVDCGMIILEVFEKTGLIPHVVPPHYGPDFMLHRSDEWYVEIILRFGYEIFEPPYLPGDGIVMKHGRIYCHGGIVVDWPVIIHASMPDRVVLYGNAELPPLLKKKKRMFRYKEFK